MSSSNGGKFQSGRDVFETFIPDYAVAPSRRQRRALGEPTESRTAEFIEELLNDFSQHLASISQNKAERA